MDLRKVSDWLAQRPMAADALFAFALFWPVWWWVGGIESVPVFQMRISSYPLRQVALFVIALGFVVPLIWRRVNPELACLLVMPVHLLQLIALPTLMYYWYGLTQPIGNVVVLILLYSAARYSEYAKVWLGVGLGAAAVLALRLIGFPFVDGYWFGVANVGYLLMSWGRVLAPIALLVSIAWALGMLARYRSESVVLVRGKDEAVEREQEQIRRLAAEQERSRIAREMHDIVAHSLSVIVVQADGADYAIKADGTPDAKLATTSRALQVIAETARTALAETRNLVGVLRSEGQDAELAPMVDLSAIRGLVDRTREAGLPIELCIEGEPGEHAPLGAATEAACYRIVQEALTNVLKHAGPHALATVIITHTPDGLEIVVRDDGTGPLPRSGVGHGLIGMRERVEAAGGTLVTRARQPRGFEVLATLPARKLAG